MKKIFIIMLISILLFSGCTGQYSYEENEFENGVNLDANVNTDEEAIKVNAEVEKTDENINVNVNVEKEEVYNGPLLTIERLETDGTVYVKNIDDSPVKVEVSIPNTDCESNGEGIIKSKAVGFVNAKGCNLVSNEVYSVVAVTSQGVFQANLIARGGQPVEDDGEFVGKLNTILKSDGSVALEWNAYNDKSNFKYYKVVHSTTNSDLKYPEDGYITYITDMDKTEYVDSKKVQSGTNYYRITTVLKDNTKIHSNVEKIYIGNIENKKIDVEVVQVYATGTSDGSIDNSDTLTMVVRLGSDSSEVKFSELELKVDSNKGIQKLEYGFDKDSYNDYSVSYISNKGNAIKNNYLSIGDLAQLTFMNSNIISEGETATIKVLTEDGGVKPVVLTTPSAMTQETTYLFP